MANPQPDGDQGAPPTTFGPGRRYLIDQVEDHESGWMESPETPGGGAVPRLRSDREVNRAPLADQFRQRIEEARSAGAEGR